MNVEHSRMVSVLTWALVFVGAALAVALGLHVVNLIIGVNHRRDRYVAR